MLQAQKAALQNRVRVRLQGIRELELTLYTRSCHQLATVASVLSGLSWFGIVYRPMRNHGLGGHEGLGGSGREGAYLVLLCVSLGLAIQCSLVASLVAMLGPGLALRGPDGAVPVAIDGMRAFYKLALLLLLCAVLALHGALVAFVWASGLSPAGRLCSNGCAAASVVLIVRYARQLLRFYALPEAAAPGSAQRRLDGWQGSASAAPPQPPNATGSCELQPARDAAPTAERAPGDARGEQTRGRAGQPPVRASLVAAAQPPAESAELGLDGLIRRTAARGSLSVRAAVQELSAQVGHRGGAGVPAVGSGSKRRVAYSRMGCDDSADMDAVGATCELAQRAPPAS
jgi:hypothetical protein